MSEKKLRNNLSIKQTGNGIDVPPSTNHVIIYFNQKGHCKEQALRFISHFNKRSWKNFRGEVLSNWKQIAWKWILKKIYLQKNI